MSRYSIGEMCTQVFEDARLLARRREGTAPVFASMTRVSFGIWVGVLEESVHHEGEGS